MVHLRLLIIGEDEIWKKLRKVPEGRYFYAQASIISVELKSEEFYQGELNFMIMGVILFDPKKNGTYTEQMYAPILR